MCHIRKCVTLEKDTWYCLSSSSWRRFSKANSCRFSLDDIVWTVEVWRVEADISDLWESRFLLSLDLLETLDLFSDTRASESLVLCERDDDSDLVRCKDPLLPVMPAAETDESSRLML